MKSQIKRTWQFFLIILALVTLTYACSSPKIPEEITDQPKDEPISNPTQETDLLGEAQIDDLFEEQLEFVMPDMPGRTIPLEFGGSIFVPEGALPETAEIDAQVSENPPLLPEGVVPVGDALIITADAQPSSPVLIQMPIPKGGNDPDNLFILRTSSDGMTTALVTWVDGDDLVAYTPGFSHFSIGEFIGEFIKEQKINIQSSRTILTGQRKTISVRNIHPDQIFDAKWTVSNKATLLQQGDVSATIQAGEEEGWIEVTYNAINLTQGLRWFGSKIIPIERLSKEGNVSGQTRNFGTSVTSENTALYEDEGLLAVVNFYGQLEFPVTWSYSVRGCRDPVGMRTADSRPKSIPPIKCPSRPTIYAIEIEAEDAVGKKDYAVLFFKIFSRPFMINIDGPRTLEWRTGGVKGSYKVIPNDGYNNPVYSYTWRITPGGDWSPIESRETGFVQEFAFNQPGEHRLEVRTTNGKGDEAKATIPIMVTGADPLDAHILGWPEEIKIDEPANFSFRAGGGTLVTGGQKGGYKVSIYWGDGTTVEESNVGISQTGYAPTIFDMTHQWVEPGPYTVMLFVEDPTGTIAYSEVDIVVEEKTSSERYEGVVRFEYMGVQGDMPSFVELTITGETVTAVLEFTLVFEASFPDSGKYCKENFYHLYSGEGPLTNPLSVEMALVDYNYSSEGNNCSNDDNSWEFTTTIQGDFTEDGSFYGVWLDQNGQQMIGYTIIASKVE